MKEGAVAGPARVARGQVFFATTGKQEARIPTLDEVKERVRADAVRDKARDVSRQRAESLAAQFKTNFESAAKTAGLEVKTTELIPRGSPLPDVGVSPAVDASTFALPAGSVTAPIATDAGTGDRTGDRAAGRQAGRARRRARRPEDGTAERAANAFFGAYMAKARERLKTSIDEESVRTRRGSGLRLTALSDGLGAWACRCAPSALQPLALRPYRLNTPNGITASTRPAGTGARCGEHPDHPPLLRTEHRRHPRLRALRLQRLAQPSRGSCGAAGRSRPAPPRSATARRAAWRRPAPAETTGIVHQSDLLGLRPRPHASLRDAVELLHRHVP